MAAIENQLRELREAQTRIEDRFAIEEQIACYCRAIDRTDLDLLKSVFHADGFNHGYDGVKPAHPWCEEIIGILRALFSGTMHHVNHKSIAIEGNQAVSESYFIAYHLYPGPGGLDDVIAFAGREYAAQCAAEGLIDGGHEYICGGRYLHKWEKREGTWRLIRRGVTTEWNHFRPSTHGDPASIMSLKPSGERRDRDDPVFALFAEIGASAA